MQYDAETLAVRGRICILASCLLTACTAAAPPPPTTASKPSPPIIIGGDKDEHGCKASAGYTWCARENACVRPWELAREEGFKLEGDAFERHCNAGR